MEGTVILDITVLPDGSVRDVVLQKTPGDGLEQKAMEIVQNWKLKPATDKEGNPVAARVKIEVTFRIYKNHH